MGRNEMRHLKTKLEMLAKWKQIKQTLFQINDSSPKKTDPDRRTHYRTKPAVQKLPRGNTPIEGHRFDFVFVFWQMHSTQPSRHRRLLAHTDYSRKQQRRGGTSTHVRTPSALTTPGDSQGLPVPCPQS